MLAWLSAYLVTCAVEVPLVVWLTRRLGWWGEAGPGGAAGPRLPEAVAVGWTLQLTHPVLWLVDPEPWAGLLVAEGVIVAVEALALAGWAARRLKVSPPVGGALLVTLVANASSLVVGLAAALAG